MRASIPVLLALAVGCATGVVVHDVVAPARAQGQTGPSFEYDVVHTTAPKTVAVKYGQQGWRLVTTTYLNRGMPADEYDLFFERQLAR